MKQTRAITLIALITIVIVLLILAGVTINMVLGENGLLKRTHQVEDKYNKAAALNEVELKVSEIEIKYYGEEQRRQK